MAPAAKRVEQQAEQVETIPPIPGEAVQVDIPHEESQVQIDGEDARIQDALTEEQTREEPPPPKKKPPQRADKRVANALGERDQWRNAATDLQRQLDAERAKAQEYERGRMQAEVGTFKAIEGQKRSELEKAKNDYTQARLANDTAAEADALERIASTRASLNDVEAWNATRQPEAEQRAEVRQPQAQPQPQPEQGRQLPPPPPDATTNEYLQDNRWFLPYQYDESGNAMVDQRTGKLEVNPDYDPDMHNEATLLHVKLTREYNKGKFQHAPGSRGYFDEIENHMRQEFPDYFGDDQESQEQQQPASRTPPMQQSRQPVAPASRSGLPGQNNGTKRGDKPTLTQEQAEFARSLRDAKSPGYIYPRGHAKAGQPMSDQDAYYKHWTEVKKDEPNTVTR